MKKILCALIFLTVAITSQAKADGFLDASKNYLQKYGIPCVTGVAAGYVIDRQKGVQIGAIGCVIVFTYGEFGRGANRTITSDDLDIINDLINKSSQATATRFGTEYDLRLDHVTQRILDESTSNRQQIRNAVTDLGVFLDKDLSDKVDRKMENPAMMKQVDQKITDAVKDEVQSELRSKERDIIERTAEKVIKRVTAEPIILDKPVKQNAEPAQ
jgi:hypothetical protein